MDVFPEIERSVEVPADAAEVWERLIDGDLAEEWIGVRVDPRRGGSVTVPDREVIGIVEEIVPGESITWSWRDVEGEPSQVTIGVTPTGNGSRVTVVERLLQYEITGVPPVILSKAA